jgi:uncharacterized protein (DUF1330 family)
MEKSSSSNWAWGKIFRVSRDTKIQRNRYNASREEPMSYENLVGLDVTDEKGYDQYRRAMSPILGKFGGGFRYDFKISEILINETANKINRVFVIRFPDKAGKDAFFADPEYKAIRAKYFETSVAARTVISEYGD